MNYFIEKEIIFSPNFHQTPIYIDNIPNQFVIDVNNGFVSGLNEYSSRNFVSSFMLFLSIMQCSFIFTVLIYKYLDSYIKLREYTFSELERDYLYKNEEKYEDKYLNRLYEHKDRLNKRFDMITKLEKDSCEEYDKLVDRLNVNDNTVIIENTPNGIVYISYSKKDDAFWYWSNKQQSIDILNVCARKYVVQTNKYELYNQYLDDIFREKFEEENEEENSLEVNEEEKIENEQKEEEKIEKKEEPKEEEKKSVFIKRKKVDKNNKERIVEKIIQNINIFKNKGTLKDYQLTQNKKYTMQPKKDVSYISFSMFKSMMGKTT